MAKIDLSFVIKKGIYHIFLDNIGTVGNIAEVNSLFDSPDDIFSGQKVDSVCIRIAFSRLTKPDFLSILAQKMFQILIIIFLESRHIDSFGEYLK